MAYTASGCGLKVEVEPQDLSELCSVAVAVECDMAHHLRA